MNNYNNISPDEYSLFLSEIKGYIKIKQLEAFRSVNRSLIQLYWQIGLNIVEKQEQLQWGNAVIKMLSQDLQREFPNISGFSSRNLHNMRKIFLAYHEQPQLQELLAEVGWSHHTVIVDKVIDPFAREYYLRATKKYGWTINVLTHKIESKDLERFAKSKSQNFDQSLPDSIRNQAKLAIKDHFIFDFLEMGESHSERELEDGLIQNLQQFILELGLGEFTFIGRQFKIIVGKKDFFIDILFYHRSLSCLIAFDLKVGEFQPEYAGKMNFYLTALDRQVRKPHEKPSIGIILCKSKDASVIEYAFADVNKPMETATYSFSKELPAEYQGILPAPQILAKQILQWDQDDQIEEQSRIHYQKSIIQSQQTQNLTARQTKFLQTVKIGQQITTTQYAAKMQVSSSTALRDLKKLVEKQFVEKVGKNKGGYFQIKANL